MKRLIAWLDQEPGLVSTIAVVLAVLTAVATFLFG